MSDLHGFILHAQTKPEKAAEFEALFSSYVSASRSEDGCIEYHMLRDQQDLAIEGASGRSLCPATHGELL